MSEFKNRDFGEHIQRFIHVNLFYLVSEMRDYLTGRETRHYWYASETIRSEHEREMRQNGWMIELQVADKQVLNEKTANEAEIAVLQSVYIRSIDTN